MYKPIDKRQSSFLDFNQPMGLHMNLDNRWIKMADRIPWDEFEIKYAELFPDDNKVHSVEHRIVSIPQLWLRPIVRGKVRALLNSAQNFI